MATAQINDGDGDGAGGEDAATAASVDAGPRQRGSVRTCVVTREAASPESLLRFVEAPDGTVMPDLKRSLPGRGSGSRQKPRRYGRPRNGTCSRAR